MEKSGLVMKIDKNYAFLMTEKGDFIKVEVTNGINPCIGEEYTGSIVLENNTTSQKYKYSFKGIAASFIIFLFMGYGLFSYFNPVTFATIDINPSIKVASNKFNKVVYVTPLNEDGKKIVSEISLKNLTVDDALVKIIEQSIKDKFITEKYLKDKKIIKLNMEGSNVQLKNFEKVIEKQNLSVEIKSKESNKTINPHKEKTSPDKKDEVNDTLKEAKPPVDKDKAQDSTNKNSNEPKKENTSNKSENLKEEKETKTSSDEKKDLKEKEKKNNNKNNKDNNSELNNSSKKR